MPTRLLPGVVYSTSLSIASPVTSSSLKLLWGLDSALVIRLDSSLISGL